MITPYAVNGRDITTVEDMVPELTRYLLYYLGRADTDDWQEYASTVEQLVEDRVERMSRIDLHG